MSGAIFTQRSKYFKDRVNVCELFMNYPYKVSEKASKPYVPVSEHSDHEYALTYKEYSKLITRFQELLIEYLMSGSTYRFSSAMGELKLIRFKSMGKDTNGGSAIAKTFSMLRRQGLSDDEIRAKIHDHPEILDKYSYFNSHLGGQKFSLAWFRSGYNVRFGNYWSMNMSYSLWRSVWDYYLKSPGDIYKLSMGRND